MHSRLLRRSIGTALGAALLMGGLAVRSASADDTALFTSTVAPNVVMIFDNSASMNNVVWHPAFRPDVVYDPVNCPYIADPNDPDYDPRCLKYPLCDITTSDTDLSSGIGNSWLSVPGEIWYYTRNGKIANRCDNDREIFVDNEVKTDGNSTAWTLEYLNWYFSDNVEEDPDGDGRTILDEILDPDDGVNSACLQGLGFPVNYAKYRRARVTAAKQITRDVICRTNQIANIRYGLAKFYSSSDPDGGWIVVPVDDYSVAQSDDLENGISAIEGDLYTPLAETLYNVYRYFMSRTASETALGKNGTTRFPVYDIMTNGSINSASAPPSPVTDDCQKHFVVILTDGEPTQDTFLNFTGTTQSDFQTKLIGDYRNPGDEVETSAGGLYLDDVAAYMQDVDFYPTAGFPGKQTVDVYTVGFTTNATANAMLEKTAAAGNGLYFFSNNAEELAAALTAALADIVVKSKSFTAATVPASRATDGNNFFASYFTPSNDDPFWPGHLKTFEFNAAGEVRDKPTAAQQAANQPGDCALLDPVAGRCLAGALDLAKEGYWDAANEIPAPAARNLYVSRFQSGPPATIPTTPDAFDEGTVTATDLGVTAADIPSYAAAGNGTSGITTDEELADAIVRYVQGCEFGSGSCVDRGDGKKLWDIFHSNPVVVGPPNLGLRELSYREFVSRYKYRKRVIYAGSNGGFLHGFNAGEYNTAAVPDAYDRGDGTEEMGFMAYPARQNIAELPIDDPPRGTASWNGYTMDGTPVASDVWLYPAANVKPDDVSTNAWNRWRSVLVGGMREGGHVVYALDVTNPPDFNSAGGEQALGPAYPSYLWEFPCEDATDGLCNGTGFLPTGQVLSDYMGQTWSEPVITRVKVRLSDTCSPSPCPVFDRWVAIFGGGYDTTGDPNHPGYDASVGDATSRKGRAVFMVDITTGEVLAMRRFDNNAVDGDVAMRFAFAASPAVFDLDFDGSADVAYFGDLGGNLWKWVIADDVIDPINGTGGDEEQRWDGTDGWKFFKIMSADYCSPIDGCTGAAPAPPPHYRSFYYPPAGAMVGSKLWLALGSGERNHLDYVGSVAGEKNRFYVFYDQDPLERVASLPATGVARYNDSGASPHFADGTTLSGCALPAGAVGYYLEAEQGEKFITNTEIFFGVVLSSSYKPSSGASACDAAGEAFLYGFDLLCASGALPDPGNSGSTVRRVSIGSGLPNRPRVSVGPTSGGGGGGGGGPCQDRVVVITSDGEAFTECPGGRPDSGVRVNTWRDRAVLD